MSLIKNKHFFRCNKLVEALSEVTPFYDDSLNVILEYLVMVNLEYLQTSYLTEEICLYASQRDHRNMDRIPEEFKTSEFYQKAWKRNIISPRSIPSDQMTIEIYLDAVEKGYIFHTPFPQLMKDPRYLPTMKKYDPLSYFRDTPDIFKSYDFCLESVKKNGSVINYISKDKWTYELCLEAVKTKGYLLEHLPDRMITSELCLEAVKSYYHAIDHVPKQMRTTEMYLEVLKAYPYYVFPDDFYTPETWLAIWERMGALYSPPKEALEEIVQVCISKYGYTPFW